MFKDLKSFMKTRKFWTAIASAVVAYLTVKFGVTPELSLLTGVLGAFGVYAVPNEA